MRTTTPKATTRRRRPPATPSSSSSSSSPSSSSLSPQQQSALERRTTIEELEIVLQESRGFSNTQVFRDSDATVQRDVDGSHANTNNNRHSAHEQHDHDRQHDNNDSNQDDLPVDDDNDDDDDDISSVGSLSTVEDLLQEDPLLDDVYSNYDDASSVHSFHSFSSSHHNADKTDDASVVKFSQTRDQKTIDVAQYMAQREMTPLQERMNAITMIPNPVYCLYFIVASLWLDPSYVQQAHHETSITVDEDAHCIRSSWFPQLHAMPPLTIIAVAFGIAVHAPFSFIYHWKYACALPAGFARTNHWSRRMDQSFIHVCSAFLAYGTSGSVDYFLGCLLFNADCIYRQFKRKVCVSISNMLRVAFSGVVLVLVVVPRCSHPFFFFRLSVRMSVCLSVPPQPPDDSQVRPRRNQIRIGLSILAYTFPILRRGDVALFSRCWMVLFLAGWFFVKYPLGGWSHAAFHFVIALIPPLLMKAALDLPSSYDALRTAGQCAVLAEHNGL